MFDNAQRLKTAAASLKKCGVNTSGFEAKMEKFQLEDVTEAMYWFMRVAKEYGQERAREFLKGDISPQEFLENNFIDMVNNGAVYDIKIQPLFKRHHQYYFDGYVIDFDDTGNILYGVYGMAMFKTVHDKIFVDDLFGGVGYVSANMAHEYLCDGESLKDWEVKKFLHLGAGLNNYKSAINAAKVRGRNIVKDKGIEDPKLIKEIIKAEKKAVHETEWGWANKLFDDPRDYEAIELGFEYYDKI